MSHPQRRGSHRPAPEYDTSSHSDPEERSFSHSEEAGSLEMSDNAGRGDPVHADPAMLGGRSAEGLENGERGSVVSGEDSGRGGSASGLHSADDGVIARGSVGAVGGDIPSGDAVDSGYKHSDVSENPEFDVSSTAADVLESEDLSELLAVRAERDSYLSDLQRITAEFANFRRQTAKRNIEIVAQAAAHLVEALLPVLDACEAAVSQEVEGIGALQSQLLGVLESEGLSVVGVKGEIFDPNRHDAVTHELSDDETEAAGEPFVEAVLRTGYAWKSKVLRPAMVRVKG